MQAMEVDIYRNRSNSSRSFGDVFSGLTPVLKNALTGAFVGSGRAPVTFELFAHETLRNRTLLVRVYHRRQVEENFPFLLLLFFSLSRTSVLIPRWNEV